MNAISSITLYNVNINVTNQYDGFATDDTLTIEQKKLLQKEYFNKHIVANYVKCNYVPRTSTIKIRNYVEDIRNANYLSYTNEYNGQSHTYYCFILQKKYIAKNTTELTIAIDTFQTYYFEMSLEQCFIEREHVQSDELGEHTVPENLELGEYLIAKQTIIDEYNDICYIMAVSDTEKESFSGNIYGKVYHGFTLYYYNSGDYTQLGTKIKSICDSGKADSIAFIFTCPKKIIIDQQSSIKSGDELNNANFSSHIKDTRIIDCRSVAFQSKNNRNVTYTPHNNKLNTYPYSFITVKNSSGEVVTLKREYFYNELETELFDIDCVLSQQPTIAITPRMYKGEYKCYDNSIELHGYPLCSWNNDTFGNWLAQNRNTINANKTNAYTTMSASRQIASNNYNNATLNKNLNAINSVANVVGSLGNTLINPLSGISGAVSEGAKGVTNYMREQSAQDTEMANNNISASTSYENEIRSIMAQTQDASILPNTCRGDTTGNGLDICRDSNSFYIDFTTINDEMAKRIDRFFDMFGYQVNTVHKPNLQSRRNHNYIKTTNARIVGNIPHEDVQVLENTFNNGIHIWHNESYMYKFNIKNDIVKTVIEAVPDIDNWW